MCDREGSVFLENSSPLTDVTKGCWDTHRVCTGDPVSLTLMWNMFDFDIAFCLCHI